MSKSIKSIQICIRGKMEWIGEMFLNMKDPAKDPFPFSVIALTKLVVYGIHQKDLKYLPQSMKDQFKLNGTSRAEFIKEKWVTQFNYLKSIKKNLFSDFNEMNGEENTPGLNQSVDQQINQMIEKGKRK